MSIASQTYASTNLGVVSDLGEASAKAKSSVAPALRFGYDFFQLTDTMSIQGNVGMQFKTKSDIVGSSAKESGVIGKATYENVSLGAMFQYRNGVDAAAGLEWRFEKNGLELSGVEGSHKASRPWLRANIGYTFALTSFSPFLKLEVAAPLKTASYDRTATDSATKLNSFADAMSPKFQIGLVGGVRF